MALTVNRKNFYAFVGLKYSSRVWLVRYAFLWIFSVTSKNL